MPSPPESQNGLNMTNSEKLVTLFYRLILGREPDIGGLEHWKKRLEKESLKIVLCDFLNSKEVILKHGKDRVEFLCNIVRSKILHTSILKFFLLTILYIFEFLKALTIFKTYIKIYFGRGLTALTGKIYSINLYERKFYSQNGEDGILEEIFRKIDFFNKFCVELGSGDGSECNTRYLIEKYGLRYLLIDGGIFTNTVLDIKREFLTAENINLIFMKYNVPGEFDLLSIDIDYNTFWIWHALDNRYRPRVVVVEYNSLLPPDVSWVVKYDPEGVWQGDDYFGASLKAFVKLAKKKGYTLVGCESRGVNAFFVRDDIAERHFLIRDYRSLYRKATFSYPPSKKEFIAY